MWTNDPFKILFLAIPIFSLYLRIFDPYLILVIAILCPNGTSDLDLIFSINIFLLNIFISQFFFANESNVATLSLSPDLIALINFKFF